MATFTEVKTALDEIAARTDRNRKQLDNAITAISAADTDLGNMPAIYAAIVADINTAAAANPNDAAWQNAKAEKDLMVTDFQAQKTRAAALKAAVEAI